MMNAEILGGSIMGGGQLPGQNSGHGFSAGRTARAIGEGFYNNKVMSKSQAIDALTSDGRTEVNEFFRADGQGLKIDKVRFKTGKAIVTDTTTGKKSLQDTVYFAHFANRSLADVTNPWEENGKLRDRVEKISRIIHNTTGDVAWFSSGENGDDRLYIAKHDGKGEGELYSVQLQHQKSDTVWNFIDALSGKPQDRTGDVKDVVILRDRRRGDAGLRLDEAVLTYVDKLSFEERKAFAPTIHLLIKEATMPEEVRDRNIAEQGRYIRGEIEKLLEEYGIQKALGVMGQSLGEWAKLLDGKESVMNKTSPIAELGTGKNTAEHMIQGKKLSDVNTKYLVMLPYRDPARPAKRHRGHSGGRGFRCWRRLAELKIAGIEIVPRRGKLKAEEVGASIVRSVKDRIRGVSETVHQYDSISSHTILKRRSSSTLMKRFSPTLRENIGQVFVRQIQRNGEDERIHMPWRKNAILGERPVMEEAKIKLNLRKNSSFREQVKGKLVGNKSERLNELFKYLIERINIRRKKKHEVLMTSKERKISSPRIVLKEYIRTFTKEIRKRRRKMGKEIQTYKKIVVFFTFLNRDKILNKDMFRKRKDLLGKNKLLRGLVGVVYGKESYKKTIQRVERVLKLWMKRLDVVRLRERYMIFRLRKKIHRLEMKRSDQVLFAHSVVKNKSGDIRLIGRKALPRRLFVFDIRVLRFLRQELERILNLTDSLVAQSQLKMFLKPKKKASRLKMWGASGFPKGRFPRRGVIFSFLSSQKRNISYLYS